MRKRQMKNSILKPIYFLLLLGMASMTVAHGKTCSPQDAEAADAIIDHLDSWAQVESAFKKFRHCDDGSIAEGNSEAVARLLVDRWQTLPQLAALIKRNPALRRFVVRHIDGTLDTADLEKIKKISSSSCPQGMAALCNDLHSAATHATK